MKFSNDVKSMKLREPKLVNQPTFFTVIYILLQKEHELTTILIELNTNYGFRTERNYALSNHRYKT